MRFNEIILNFPLEVPDKPTWKIKPNEKGLISFYSYFKNKKIGGGREVFSLFFSSQWPVVLSGCCFHCILWSGCWRRLWWPGCVFRWWMSSWRLLVFAGSFWGAFDLYFFHLGVVVVEFHCECICIGSLVCYGYLRNYLVMIEIFNDLFKYFHFFIQLFSGEFPARWLIRLVFNR